jgi:glucokinase
MRDEFTVIGIDVGGTKVAAALVSFPAGRLLSRPRRISSEGGPTLVLDSIFRVAETLAAEALGHRHKVQGIGFGICEIVEKNGKIGSAAMFNWTEMLIEQRLSGIAPVIIEADVRAGARAEAAFGAGRGLDCFLYVSVGTGISCCLVIDGEPFLGANGATGTMGSGRLPTIDSRTPITLEQVASGYGLRERFNRLGGKAGNAKEVFAAADQGNQKALELVENAAIALGGAVGWFVNVLDPAAVILGGGLGLRGGNFRKRLVRAAHEHAWWPRHRKVPIKSAATGANAGVIGAAAAAWTEFRTGQ